MRTVCSDGWRTEVWRIWRTRGKVAHVKIPRLISSLGQEFWQPGFRFVLALPSQNPATAIGDIELQPPTSSKH